MHLHGLTDSNRWCLCSDNAEKSDLKVETATAVVGGKQAVTKGYAARVQSIAVPAWCGLVWRVTAHFVPCLCISVVQRKGREGQKTSANIGYCPARHSGRECFGRFAHENRCTRRFECCCCRRWSGWRCRTDSATLTRYEIQRVTVRGWSAAD